MSISALNSGISGMKAYQQALDSSSHNIANVNTTNFSPQNINFQERNTGGVVTNINREESNTSGTDINYEVVQSIEYKAGFDMAAKIVKTQDEILGTLINIKA